MRICQPIDFIQGVCVEFAARKFNANDARKVAGELQMHAQAFANASTRKVNAALTKFHLSPTVNSSLKQSNLLKAKKKDNTFKPFNNIIIRIGKIPKQQRRKDIICIYIIYIIKYIVNVYSCH